MRISSFLAAVTLLCASLAARADTFSTFDLKSTFNGGGSVTGTLTVDNTTNTFTAADLVGTGFSAAALDFTTITSQGVGYGGGGFSSYGLFIYDGSIANVVIGLPVASFSGYSGSNVLLGGITQLNTQTQYFANSGSLAPATSAVTPEPSSMALLGTGLLGVAGVVKRRIV